MVLTDVEGEDLDSLSAEQRQYIDTVGPAVAKYVKAGKELVDGRLSHLKEIAPPHLVSPGNVLVGLCSEGLVIRYETTSDKPRVIGAWLPGSLAQNAALLSQNLILCRTAVEAPVPPKGMELKFLKIDPTGASTDIASLQLAFDTVVSEPKYRPIPPRKPFCLLSVRNSLEIQILGETIPVDPAEGTPKRFIVRSHIRLQAGWDCIEVFPFLQLDEWRAENAELWAENDILGAALAYQLTEARFHSLDPNAEARRVVSALLDKYKALLDSEPEKEEMLQEFLTQYPALLCPAYARVWPKLPFGAHKTDFVFQEASGDYLLVELEKSTDVLFIKDGHSSRELNHARGQVQDWKRYLEDNLSTVQREIGLAGISSNPKALIVMGRSASLTDENRRKLMTLENEAPRLKVMTYDDIFVNAKAVAENLLGPLWNNQGNTRVYYLPHGP